MPTSNSTKCEGCGDNCHYKTIKVGTRGPIDSPFMIIGEGPGVQEIVQGAPFVGPSGEVITKALEKTPLNGLGIEPYFSNAFQCFAKRYSDKKLHQEHQVSAVRACRDRLLKEITAYPRKLILVMGNPALWALLNNYSLKITQERGKLFKSELAEIGILATVHPAFLLRGGGNYLQFQQDIDYAVDLLSQGNKALRLPNGTTYEVLETPQELRGWHSRLLSMPKQDIACDYETTGFNHQTDHILCLGIQHHPKRSVVIPDTLLYDPSNRDIVENIFGHHIQVWHNGKFDCRFATQLNMNARVDEDTMLMSYTLNERRGIHDLDQVSSDWLGSVNHKHIVKPYITGTTIDEATGKKRKRHYGDIPRDILYKYLALDINDTYALKQKLRPLVAQDPSLEYFYTQHCIRASRYLLKVELNGILVDNASVMQNFSRLKGECDIYEEKINQISLEVTQGQMGCNPRSPIQLKKLMYDILKLAPNSWSTDDDSLIALKYKLEKENRSIHPIIQHLQDYRGAHKSLGTYVAPLIEDRTLLPTSKKECLVFPDGRVHQTYMIHGTATSRLSCNGPNVQNIPRDPLLRGMFMARAGHLLLECDYSQAELRCLAVLSNCSDLLEIFWSGKDLHVEVTLFLFGANWTKEDKMAAKTVNFGIVYGRTAPSIANDPMLNAPRRKAGKPDITVAEAQSWIDGWATRFPGAWKFIQDCRNAPILNQTMKTCFGNKKRPGVVSAEKLWNLQNESANFPHQSTASNLTVRAGAELFDTLRDEHDTHICNTVHDCIVAETPANLTSVIEVANLVTGHMEALPKRFAQLRGVPWKAEAEIGWRWGNFIKLSDLQTQYDNDLNKIPTYIAPH